MINSSCAIIGHNPQRFSFKYNEQAPLCTAIKATITEQIKELISIGVTHFYVGCAVGVDTWTAETVIALKQQPDFSGIELISVISFPEHTAKFTAKQAERYQQILSQCTDKVIVSNHFSPVAYKRLNYYLVDNAKYLIAVYDQNKSERSGLTQAVNYAVKKNLSIVFIHPDTAQISDNQQ